MTQADVVNFVIDVFEGDGTYTDAPGDHGGATRWGVTRGFRARAVGHPVSKADIRNLTRAQAIETYEIILLDQARLGLITDWRIFFVAYDFSVNAGEDDGIPTLQRALGVTADGQIGSQTLAAIAAADPYRIAMRCLMVRQLFHIAQSYKPNQAQWIRGWLRRCTVVGQTIAGTPQALAAVRRLVTQSRRRRPTFGEFSNHRDRVIATRRAARRRS